MLHAGSNKVLTFPLNIPDFKEFAGMEGFNCAVKVSSELLLVVLLFLVALRFKGMASRVF